MTVQDPDADFSHLRPVCQSSAGFVLLLMWDDGNTVDAVSVHTQLVVATELALTGNHLGARQSIQEGLREHKLELLILH